MDTIGRDNGIAAMIYLDNAATSWPKPPRVLEAMQRFLLEDAANPGRASHRMAIASERMLDDLRRGLARLFDANDPRRMILCASCTDALNIAIKGTLREGDHVVTTVLEHNSVSRPLQAMADAGFIELTRVGVGADTVLDPDEIAAALRPNTRLVAVVHASNVTGAIQPIDQIGRLVRERELLFLVDAAQSAGCVPISVRAMNIDLLALPGHKALMGPPGTGVLYVGPLVEIRPWREGGTGGDSASPTQPREFPHLLEAGTPNTVGFAGLAAAIGDADPLSTGAHERQLVEHLAERLTALPGVKLVAGPIERPRVGVLSFTLDAVSPSEAGVILDQSFDIAVRTGLHCAPYAHRALGTFPDGTIRASVSRSTTIAEIDALVEAVGHMA